MRRGDHLVSLRTGYTHHGIYIGCGEVLHYSGFGDSVSGPICRVSLDRFSGGKPPTVLSHPAAVYDAEERIARGYSRLGENSYTLVTNNCEHFVSWCIYGVSTCQQIRNVLRAAGTPGTTIVPSIAAVISAASQSDESVQTAAKVAAKEAMSSAAIIGAATIVGGPIGLAGAAAILAAKKVLFK